MSNEDSFMETFSMHKEFLGNIWQRIVNYNIEARIIQNVKGNQYIDRVFPPDIILPENKSLILGGYFGQLFDIFNKKFNISFKISQNKHFGAFINSSWVGMVGDLTYGRADISTGISMTSQRGKYIKFSQEFYLYHLDIIYRNLDQEKWHYAFYLQPYNTDLWLCIVAISLVVIVLKVLENYVLRRKHFGSWVTNFINELLLWWPIVLQGNLLNFSLKSLKLVFGIYIAFSMLLLISYNSKLTSLLAITHLKIPFSSLEEMIASTNFLPAILKDSSSEEMFRKPPYDNMDIVRVESLIEGIESVYSGKLGLIASFQVVQHIIGRNCSFDIAPRYINKEPISLGYSKQFAFVEYFNYKISLMKQYGILSAEFKRYYPARQICIEKNFNPVSFGEIIGLFIFTISAILLSLIVGIFELIIGKFM
uniref:Ionotropic glutamate receptor L-glutamate and glycine-binding domain-containing protein n=1 Tax=Strigamia maritima TaxID=126957 RepID=T1JMM8_STRMM